MNAAHRHHPLALEARRLSASHGPTQVLFDVDLPARSGEWLAIVGPNGCGKTTLLNLLPRFYDPSAGAVKLDGIEGRFAGMLPPGKVTPETRAMSGLFLLSPGLIAAPL